ncbi:MAG: hypothetical protein HDR56_04255 [Treponema sp.]|nr:hypothetical protein [Treponema sp.]MBD5413449.1 hypothetical protein [Treponema sp.]
MNIKKIGAIMTVAICAAVLSATDIETALQQTADQFSASIKKGTTIAIVGISSDSAEMSDFMLDDLTMRFVQARTLTVANRANLDAIKTEMNFQLSGEVSDESIQQLGAMVGAKVVVHGKLIPLGRSFNLTVQALNVETAAVIDMCRIRVEPNDTTEYLLASKSNIKGMPKRFTKYSGDFQVNLGYRGATCAYYAGGFYIGGANYNLFNINKVFSLGFFEVLSGSIGSLVGCDFIIGPAIGLYVANAVKLQAGFGFATGFDDGIIEYDEKYIYSFPWGVAFQIMAKFLPSKRVSPIITFQYEYKEGEYYYNDYYDNDHYYTAFNAFNITAGISINFGRRER